MKKNDRSSNMKAGLMRRVIAVLAAGFVMMAILALGAEAGPGGKGGGKGKPTTTTTVAAGSGWVLESLDSGCSTV